MTRSAGATGSLGSPAGAGVVEGFSLLGSVFAGAAGDAGIPGFVAEWSCSAGVGIPGFVVEWSCSAGAAAGPPGVPGPEALGMLAIRITAGRRVTKIPNPKLTRPPYAELRALGTTPADALTPMPGFSPFHASR